MGLAAQIPSDGTVCSYNGYTFNASTATLGIECRPVLDPARRTVAAVAHVITLRTYLFDDGSGTTDAQMADLRRTLTTQGAALVYENKGFGSFSVNTGGAVKDVAWGPVVEVLGWKPVGNNKACEVTWQCEVTIPECSQARYAFAIMEFNFSVAFSTDQSGYTTRTYSGHLRIPQTRTPGSRKFNDSADGYFEQINPDIPAGFRRTARSRTLSEDKCTLRFQITDVEMSPDVPPEGVVEVAAEHEHHNLNPGNFSKWGGSLSATYELARGVPKQAALRYFMALAKERLLDVRQDPNDILIPLFLSMKNPELYGKRAASFTLSYSFTSTTPRILARGLWLPPSDGDHTRWVQSLTVNNGPLSLRGNAQMRFDPSSDAIVDLCATPTARLTTQGVAPKPVQQAVLETLNTEPPAPDKSLFYFENHLYFEEDTGRVLLRTLPTVELQTVPVDGTVSGGFAQIAYLNQPDLKSQQRAAPIIFVRMIGRALRAAFEVPAPTLETVADVPVIPANVEGLNYFRCWQCGDIGFPLYAAKWDLRYALKRVPTSTMHTAANPILQSSRDATQTPPIPSNTGGGSTLTT